MASIRVSNWTAVVIISLALISLMWLVLPRVNHVITSVTDKATSGKTDVLDEDELFMHSDREKAFLHILDLIENGIDDDTHDLYSIVDEELHKIYTKYEEFFNNPDNEISQDSQRYRKLRQIQKKIKRFQQKQGEKHYLTLKPMTQKQESQNSEDDLHDANKRQTVKVTNDNKASETNDRTFPRANYAFLPPDGLGEEGRGLMFDLDNLTAEELAEYEAGYRNNEFNQFVSDRISVHRSLPEGRPAACQPIKYPSDLPATSVIICFYNEAWSTLIRTVHSVLSRSPPHLIKEIILIDDCSTMDHLKEPLERYMREYADKVKIVRLKKREGLIRARLTGVEMATAPVLTFLDSHVECLKGWLEPLLDRIARDPTTVVAPVIGAINEDTFSIGYGVPVEIGIIDLRMMEFRWVPIPDRENDRRESEADPLRTPAISGGLFSVNRDFFNKLGQYDRGMEVWGGENLEFSVKVWLCGGSLEIHPCSQVSHVFRKKSPYRQELDLVKTIERNLVRLSEVWLDNYKQYYYARIGFELGNYGDVTERKQLRENLKCHSFDWYIENVHPEMHVPPKAVFIGEVRGVTEGDPVCLDSMSADGGAKVSVFPCHGEMGNQLWRVTEDREIVNRENCLEFSEPIREVRAHHCESFTSQKWKRLKNGQIKHIDTNMCLERQDPPRMEVILKNCSDTNKQKWSWVPTDMPELKSLF